MDESDIELLRRYALDGAEEAFNTLVQRHLPLVYSAAHRQLRSAHLAEEAAQSVFIELARSAESIRPGTVMSAWLYQVTRHKVIDAIRRENRRKVREEAFHKMNLTSSNESEWSEIEPHLDEAMQRLESTDQAAILLRFFQNKSLIEVGQELGISENAAQKRISRAVGKLRQHFSGHGIHLSATALAALIAGNAVQAAPAHLMGSVAAVAFQALNPIASGTIATLNPVLMTATQKVIITTVLLATTGFGVYQTTRSARLLEENQRLQKAVLPAHAETRDVSADDSASRQIASLRAENALLKKNTAELMSLRAEITRLRNEAREAAALQSANASLVSSAQSWADRVTRLKNKLHATPEANVPELALLNEEDWLGAVKGTSLETEMDYRRALASLRNTAQNRCAILIQPALAEYIKANNNQFPTEVPQLQPYLKEPVSTEILQRFAVLPANEFEGVQMGGDWIISLRTPVDEKYDHRFAIGPNGFGGTTWDKPNTALKTLKPVVDAFNSVNGHEPADLAELEPYLKTPDQRTAYQKIQREILEGKSKALAH